MRLQHAQKTLQVRAVTFTTFMSLGWEKNRVKTPVIYKINGGNLVPLIGGRVIIYQLEMSTPQQKTRALTPSIHKHTQAYIKLHTSIYISIPTGNTYKHIHKTYSQAYTETKQTSIPKQHPKNRTEKIYYLI